MLVSETEYNELYELCESYRIERDAMRGAANSYKLHCKTLEKENETLKTLLDESFDAQNAVRAATAREMREKIKERCIAGGIYPAFVASTINRVVEEIVGEM